VAYFYYQLGNLLTGTGPTQQAEQAFRQVIEVCQKLVLEFPRSRSQRRSYTGLLRGTQADLVNLLKASGRHQDADRAQRQALDFYEKLAAPWPNEPVLKLELTEFYLELIAHRKDSGKQKEAEHLSRELVSFLQQQLENDPSSEDCRRGLAYAHHRLAETLIPDRNRSKEAEEHFRQSLALFDKLIEDFPSDLTCVEMVGHNQRWLFGLLPSDRLQEAETLVDKAVNNFEKLTVAAPNVARHHYLLADSANMQAWLLATCDDPKLRNPKKAVELAEKAVAHEPKEGRFWNTLGVAHYRAGNYKEAVAALENPLEHGSTMGSSWDWFFLAMAHWQMGDKARARKWNAAALLWMDKNQPTHPELLQLRAEAAALLGLPNQPPQAEKQAKPDDVEIYTLVLEANPAAAWSYGGRGAAYAAVGQWEKAATDLERAVQLKPDTVLLHYWLALARLGAGDLAGHRSACAAMLERFGQTDKPDVAHWVAWTSVLAPGSVKDWDPSLKLAETAARTNFYAHTLGAALYRAGRYEEAIQRLKAITGVGEQAGSPVRSSAAYPWFFLAMAHQRLGQTEEGRKCLDEGIKGMEQETNNKDLPWNRRLTLQLFRREAEALLGMKEEKTHHKDTEDTKKMP
jgi:tetratricopeptide (TPR) repeat protein